MINLNVLIDKLKTEIGLNGYLGKVYPDTLYKDIIINKSLNTFNLYSGCQITVSFNSVCDYWLSAPVIGNHTSNDVSFRIPDYIMDRFKELGVSIKSVSVKNGARIGTAPMFSRGMRDEVKIYPYKYRQSINYPYPRVKFKAPHTIVVMDYARYNYYTNNENYNLVIDCTHPKNLSTITYGLQPFFEELCKYDIMINLYNNDLRNLKVDIGSSSVDLQLENFQSAENDKKELLQKMRLYANVDQMEILI